MIDERTQHHDHVLLLRVREPEDQLGQFGAVLLSEQGRGRGVQGLGDLAEVARFGLSRPRSSRLIESRETPAVAARASRDRPSDSRRARRRWPIVRRVSMSAPVGKLGWSWV